MEKEKKSSKPGQREQNTAKRRAAIVELATRTFLKNGYEGTMMSAIAQEMGGSKGTLWSYFKSKEELFAAVMDHLAAAFQSFTMTTLESEEDIMIVLSRFCETYIGRISSPEAIAFQRIIVSQVDHFPEIGRIFHEHAAVVNHTAVTGYLAKQMEKGIIRKDDPGEAARMLLDLCTAGYHDFVLYGVQAQDQAVEKREVARIVKQFLRSYEIR